MAESCPPSRERERTRRDRQRDAKRWRAMARQIAQAPELDARPADDIIGFDEFELPRGS